MNFPPVASTQNIDKIRASADMIEEVDGLITYMGFCQPGTVGTDGPKWSIMRIVQSGSEFPILSAFTWAQASCAYNLVWDLRATYAYGYKNF